MKVVYKVIAMVVATSLLLALHPASVQAATTISPPCAALGAKQTKVVSDIAAKEAPLAQLRVKNTYNTSQAQAILKTKVAILQKDTDKKIDATFKKLNTKGKSDGQKAALAAYETEFRAALTALRAAQTTARNDYLSAFNNLNATHRATVDNQIAALKAKMSAAFAAAPIQCQKVGIEKAKAQLIASIKLAEDTYSAAPNIGMQTLQPALQAASDTFKTANDTAASAFKTSVQQSRIKLKAAIGETKYIF